MRIAVFSDSALPILNGVSVSIDALIRCLREDGHSVHLYTSACRGHRELDPNVHRFRSIRTPITKDYPLAIPPFYPWYHEFRATGFDLVHTHTPFTVGFVGLRWAQSCGLPVVSTYHTKYDKYAHYMPLLPKGYIRYKTAKHTNYYYNRVQHVITPSQAAKRWLGRHSVTTPTTVVPTGIPVPKEIDRTRARADLGVAPLQKVLLYTGRIALEKNLGALLEAAREVFQGDPSAVLWVVGDGPSRPESVAMARQLGIGDRVRFFGFVPRHELDAYYAAADVFVFPSMTETQGLVVTEAMSYGLPPVVVQGGGASGSITAGVDGFVVPNDPDDMAQAVLRLLRDPLLYDRTSRNARATALKYTDRAMERKMVEVYRRVLGEPGADPTPVGRGAWG